jgi:hypothetical protein
MKRIRLPVLVCLSLLAAAVSVAVGRLVSMPGYKAMTELSDLVVIATPIARAELPDRMDIPGVGQS